MPSRTLSDRPARILIVDDHPVVRCGLKEILSGESDLEICGEAASAKEGLAQVEELSPDLLIVDLSLRGGAGGFDLIKRVRKRWPETKMLVSSLHDEKLFAERALQAGAQGYIQKSEAADRIVFAVRQVLSGKIYLSSDMTQRMLEKSAQVGPAAPQVQGIAALSDRELEVFSLIGEALTTQGIAERLHLSVKTIESHRENIKRKLGLANTNELIRRAVEWSLRQG